MSTEAIKAISIRQPWAWLILRAGKNVENRTWRTTFRGRVLIHAAKGMTLEEYDEAFKWVARNERIPLNFAPPTFGQLERGGIVGSVEIVDCVPWERRSSPWHMEGCFGLVLQNPIALPFRPCRGKLGFFVPEVES